MLIIFVRPVSPKPCAPFLWGLTLGASYAIGHQLEPFNIGHGETSCIPLLAFCMFNASMNANDDGERHKVDILLKQDTAKSLPADKKVWEKILMLRIFLIRSTGN